MLNATVRDNILFGAAFDSERYDKVISASCLNEDLALLPAGDLTEIGERGVNLSGGQKQRIGLARAAYANADVVLLDDPFSALDNIVGRQVLHRCVLDAMATKTRILVTHRLDYAATADRVLILEGGRVIETGTVQSLRAGDGLFQRMLADYKSGYAVTAATSPLTTGDSLGTGGESATRPLTALDVEDPSSGAAVTDILAISPAAGFTNEEERSVGGVKRELYFAYIDMLGSGAVIIAILAIFLFS